MTEDARGVSLSESVRSLYRALMHAEAPGPDGVRRRVPGLAPSEIAAMTVWQAASYFPTIERASGGLHGEALAVANAEARRRGERLEPMSPTEHPVKGSAVSAALAAFRAKKGAS